jgi:hypothetical protein
MKADNGRRKGGELVMALYPIRSRPIISEITDKFRRSQVFLQDVYDFRISCNIYIYMSPLVLLLKAETQPGRRTDGRVPGEGMRGWRTYEGRGCKSGL